MQKEILPDFIVIDDDDISNTICQKIIQITIPEACVQTFTDPRKGLEHLMSNYSGSDAKCAIIFLDINMPTLSGWEVLDRIDNLSEPVKERIKIFMLSSSVDLQDKERASANPLVSGFMSKPLSQGKLQAILPDYMEKPA